MNEGCGWTLDRGRDDAKAYVAQNRINEAASDPDNIKPHRDTMSYISIMIY